MRLLLALCLVALLLATGCGSPGLTREQQVQLAVAATLSSLPRSTAAPPPTPQPTYTPMPLSGLFCEYQFCIGHPADMAFYDANVLNNPQTPNKYGDGILAAQTNNLFIELIWQVAAGTTDPQFLIDLSLRDNGDSRSGSVQPKLIGRLNVFYVAITPTAGAASTLPYGGAAAWICGDRAFAWKVYAPQQDLADGLMLDALTRFRCESH
jgi:hypothetical protein